MPLITSTSFKLAPITFAQSLSVGSEDSTPYSLSFKPDGLKMFMLGFSAKTWYEYTLSTPWDLSTASFSVQGGLTEDAAPYGVRFKPDGTKIYHTGTTSNRVYEYDVSTPWLITTASFLQSYSVVTETSVPIDVAFKPDGLTMFVLSTSPDEIFQYTLSIAWDVTSASLTSSKVLLNAETPNPRGFVFKSDGTKLFISDINIDSATEYTLSTPWDITTLSFDNAFDVSNEDNEPRGIYVNYDLSLLFIAGNQTNTVYKYNIVIS